MSAISGHDITQFPRGVSALEDEYKPTLKVYKQQYSYSVPYHGSKAGKKTYPVTLRIDTKVLI